MTMLNQIKGLHHVTSMAADARQNNLFFTDTLGLRRVKKTVNFDAPDVYHLYYGDEVGTPGTVMTYFPFPDIGRGRPGTGEVGTTVLSVPEGSLGFWEERLTKKGVTGLKREETFGEKRLNFAGPDGDGFALVEVKEDSRTPWTENGISADHAIRGFHSVAMRLRDDGNDAKFIDLETMPNINRGLQGAGSVHHVAFAVDNRATQLEVRKALLDTGYQVTPVIDRDYFWAIYFRTPGGVLFEVATNEPGFDRDEDTKHLGEGLMLPQQHKHLRPILAQTLQKLEA
jgi:glyoxalase family protein